MARKKFTNKLIDREEIVERIARIEGSDTDYISENGNVYKEIEGGNSLRDQPL